jgi:hypothetical protein
MRRSPPAAPVGGLRHDTVANNVLEDQGSWGILTSDNADPEQPPPGTHCQGGIWNYPLHGFCLFRARGNQIFSNVSSHVGFFGNPTNSDLATETLGSYTPRNCFYRNTDRGGPLTSAPADIESASVDGPPCAGAGTGTDWMLGAQLACATQGQLCVLPASWAKYPKQTRTVMLPLPRLPSMPKPCAGVPRNAFCP